MFRGEREYRTNGQNAALAGSLALVAGMVNALGFLKLGVYSSHVTGHVGKIATDLAVGHVADLRANIASVLAFFTGAFVASLAIESGRWRHTPYVYSALLLLEACMLGSVFFEPERSSVTATLALCGAMGLQNGLVTRLSGAVVRTTHLTGVVTDLGIEAARWFQWWTARMSARPHSNGTSEADVAVRPSLPKALLLSTILVTFIVGGLIGGWLFIQLGVTALAIPIFLLILGGALAFRNGMESLGPANRQ